MINNKTNMASSGLLICKVLIVFVLLSILTISVNAQTEEEIAVDKAVNDWKLLENTKADSIKAYDSVLAGEKAEESWWGYILEAIGLKDTPEETAENVKQAVINERIALADETYEVSVPTVKDVYESIQVGVKTVQENCTIVQYIDTCTGDIDCPSNNGSLCRGPVSCTLNKTVCVEGSIPIMKDVVAYQLVVMKDGIIRVPSSNKCFQRKDSIVCESQYRCDLRDGLESSCEYSEITNDKVNIFELPVKQDFITDDYIVQDLVSVKTADKTSDSVVKEPVYEDVVALE